MEGRLKKRDSPLKMSFIEEKKYEFVTENAEERS